MVDERIVVIRSLNKQIRLGNRKKLLLDRWLRLKILMANIRTNAEFDGLNLCARCLLSIMH